MVTNRTYNMRGFTLLEVLVSMSILIVLISISTLTYNCTMNSLDRDEARSTSTSVQAVIEEYYNDRGKVPLGKAVDANTLEKHILPELDSYINALGLDIPNNASDYIKSGKIKIYEIDSAALPTKGKISKESFDMFYILHSPDGATNQAFTKLNRTLLTKKFYNTCNSENFVAKVSLQRNIKASEQLEYEMTEEYLKNPNENLSNMLEK